MTSRRAPALGTISLALSCCFALASSQAEAQLRPLEQIPWRLFERTNTISAEVGASRLFDQRASLAGTSGTLSEMPNFSLAWRTGRVAIEAGGTGQRVFHEDSRFEAAYPDVEAADNGKRHDSGDYRISTAIRITPDDYAVTGMLRFGTRLPTTDNTTGLDRDATDFFVTVGASGNRGVLNVAGEGGLGIYGTRETRFEQDDLFLYSIRAELRFASFVPTLAVIGQQHGYAHEAIRGLENLSEARAGVRFGKQFWLRVEGVKGLTTFSPSGGILVTAGLVR